MVSHYDSIWYYRTLFILILMKLSFFIQLCYKTSVFFKIPEKLYVSIYAYFWLIWKMLFRKCLFPSCLRLVTFIPSLLCSSYLEYQYAQLELCDVIFILPPELELSYFPSSCSNCPLVFSVLHLFYWSRAKILKVLPAGIVTSTKCFRKWVGPGAAFTQQGFCLAIGHQIGCAD